MDVNIPLILSIETAAGCGSVALTRGGVQNGRLIAEAAVHAETSHSRQLLGSVEWVMQAAGISWSDLDAIAVSIGPGSFTGLRIGLAAAKGMVFATGKPLIAVPTLDAVALSCPLIDYPLWCIMDARKQEVYAACYGADRQHTSLTEAIRPELLAEKIAPPAVIAGLGLAEYQHIFSRIAGLRFIPPALSSPSAAKIGFLAAERLARGEICNPALAVPLYVRASEAEVNLKKNVGYAVDTVACVPPCFIRERLLSYRPRLFHFFMLHCGNAIQEDSAITTSA
ncbi:MAG: tRNA (adenosine(37)-N6)-threonylcarbamoyltransferase complex dimerization subunit type 1 TsaB [Candidatus Electronema sp. V4]|uniref:tRNA (adenosine(37)-N6)-threonylcarbamoyltransferase complex dimerization subunit type 1 TsaB n=1 Tax=Candidatus Electronema sp. V4 TaxID=3454756 RepID=UPI004055990F